jgi:hypothetical protein
MKSQTNRVLDARGVPRSITTIQITSADQGLVVSTNRTLTGLRYLDPPTSGKGAAILELVDDSVAYAVPRAIYRAQLAVDVPTKQQHNLAGTG